MDPRKFYAQIYIRFLEWSINTVELGNFGSWGYFGHHFFFISIDNGAEVYMSILILSSVRWIEQYTIQYGNDSTWKNDGDQNYMYPEANFTGNGSNKNAWYGFENY